MNKKFQKFMLAQTTTNYIKSKQLSYKKFNRPDV